MKLEPNTGGMIVIGSEWHETYFILKYGRIGKYLFFFDLVLWGFVLARFYR